jgi:hypothetical protein
VSWQATAWVKELRACPDGAPLTRGQKLLLFVLTDYHNTARKLAWPSVSTLASESLLSLSQAKRDLAYLEAHYVIERQRPERFGKGHLITYRFLPLDAPEQLSRLLHKRGQHEPFSEKLQIGSDGVQKTAESGSIRVHLAAEKGSERVQIAPALIEEQRTIELEPPTKEQHARGDVNPAVQRALSAWLAVKNELRSELSPDAWKLWLRPAELLNVFDGRFLLLALPPNNRILEAASAAKILVHSALQKRGYDLAGFTVYPDQWTRNRVTSLYPRVAATMLGSTAMKKK